jgi:hypothetical protein
MIRDALLMDSGIEYFVDRWQRSRLAVYPGQADLKRVVPLSIRFAPRNQSLKLDRLTFELEVIEEKGDHRAWAQITVRLYTEAASTHVLYFGSTLIAGHILPCERINEWNTCKDALVSHRIHPFLIMWTSHFSHPLQPLFSRYTYPCKYSVGLALEEKGLRLARHAHLLEHGTTPILFHAYWNSFMN